MDGIQYTSWNPILTCLKRIADLYVSFGMLSKMDAGKLLILSLKVICVISYSIHHIVFLQSLILDMIRLLQAFNHYRSIIRADDQALR